MLKLIRMSVASVLATAMGFVAFAQSPEPAPATRPASPATAPAEGDQAALDRAFADMLTNVRLTGSYTANDIEGIRHGDAYTILGARRADGDNWIITAQIAYKGVGVPVDLTVPVKWAGDTPVIYMTDHAIAGMGTFTVRLLFYKNEYAGTWSSKKHGGLMWGKIEKIQAPKPADPLIQPKQ